MIFKIKVCTYASVKFTVLGVKFTVLGVVYVCVYIIYMYIIYIYNLFHNINAADHVGCFSSSIS